MPRHFVLGLVRARHSEETTTRSPDHAFKESCPRIAPATCSCVVVLIFSGVIMDLLISLHLVVGVFFRMRCHLPPFWHSLLPRGRHSLRRLWCRLMRPHPLEFLVEFLVPVVVVAFLVHARRSGAIRLTLSVPAARTRRLPPFSSSTTIARVISARSRRRQRQARRQAHPPQRRRQQQQRRRKSPSKSRQTPSTTPTKTTTKTPKPRKART